MAEQEPSPEDWQRVGRAIRARMTDLRYGPTDVKRRGGPSDKTLAGYIEGAPIVRLDAERGLCDALRWQRDSVQRILAGGDPVELPPPDPDVDARLSRVESLLEELRQQILRLGSHGGAA